MTKDQAIIGTRVKSLVEFADVPAGTEGIIDEEYHLDVSGEPGYMIAWDLPEHPLPPGYKAHTGEPTIKTGLLRDGFALCELRHLEVVPPPQTGGAFTLIEVLIVICIAGILASLLWAAVLYEASHKPGVKVAEPAKPFERFTLSKPNISDGYLVVYLIHDNIDGTDVLYICPPTGNGSAVLLPHPPKPQLWKQTLIITNASSKTINVEMP